MLTNTPMLVPNLPGVELYPIPCLLEDPIESALSVYPALGVAPILLGIGGFLLRIAIAGGILVGSGFALQEFFGISAEDILPSLILGGVGATLFFARDFFKETSVARPILAIGGLAVGIGSVIVLFSGVAEAADDKVEGPIVTKISPEEIFSRLTGKILEPRDFTEVSRGLGRETYDAQFSISNPTEEDAEVTVEFETDETATFAFGIKGTEVVGREARVVSIPARSTVTDTIEIPILARDFTGQFFTVSFIDAILKLKIRRKAGTPSRNLDVGSFTIIP